MPNTSKVTVTQMDQMDQIRYRLSAAVSKARFNREQADIAARWAAIQTRCLRPTDRTADRSDRICGCVLCEGHSIGSGTLSPESAALGFDTAPNQTTVASTIELKLPTRFVDGMYRGNR